MPRLPDRGFTGRAPQTAGSIPEIPPFTPQLAETPGAMETSAALQRWWDLVKQRIEFNSGDVSKRIKTITASFDNGLATLTAEITNEQTVRADADTALAQDILTVEATVSGLSATVTTIASALATATNYLEARWTVAVTAGPIVTGMTLFSASGPDTDVSYIAFQADRFQINTATGGNQQVFSATATEVKLGAVLTVDLANAKMFIGTGTYGNANTAFYVDADGKFSLEDKLKWDGVSTLNIGNSYIGAAGEIILGTTNDVLIMTAADATYRMWIGNATAGTATFSVTKEGALFSTSGTIGGFTIATDHLRDNADTMGLSVANAPPSDTATTTIGPVEWYNGGDGIISTTVVWTYTYSTGVIAWNITHDSTFTGTGSFEVRRVFPSVVYATYSGTGGAPYNASQVGSNAGVSVGDEVAAVTGPFNWTVPAQPAFGTSVRFWAGDTFANKTIAPFRVYDDGSIYSVAGEIAGFSFNGDRFYAGEDSAYIELTHVAGGALQFGQLYSGPYALYTRGGMQVGNSSGYTVATLALESDCGVFLLHNAAGVNTVYMSGDTGMIVLSTDTNLYRSAANTLKTDDSFVAGGTISAGDGSAAAPGFAFISAPDTGMYALTDTLAFSVDGVLRGYFDDLFNFVVTDSTVNAVLGIDTYGTVGVNVGSTTNHQVQLVVNAAAVWTFQTTGNLATSNGDIRKLSDDDWGPKLFDGTAAIEFQASGGSLYGRIDGGSAILLGGTVMDIAARKVTETLVEPTITAGVVTIDLDDGTFFAVTLDAAVTSFTISNATAARVNAFTLALKQDGTGSRAVTFTFTGKTLKWPSAVVPTQTATASKEDFYSFVSYDGGTTWYGFVGGQVY